MVWWAMAWIVVAICPSATALVLPDVLSITNAHFFDFSNFSYILDALMPSTVEMPHVLPKNSELRSMIPYEQQKRLHFWVSALFLGFLAIVLFGQTLICTIGALKRRKSHILHAYSEMEDQTTANLCPKWTYSTRLFVTLSFFWQSVRKLLNAGVE